MSKKKVTLLIALSVSLTFLVSIFIYQQLPIIHLKILLAKQPNEYQIKYSTTIFAAGSTENATKINIDTFYLNDKNKVITYFVNNAQQLPPRIYVETQNISYECTTPVFMDIEGNVTPIGQIECVEKSIVNDPLSTDTTVNPSMRLNTIKSKLNRKNLHYLGTETVLNRKCKMFEANLSNIASGDSKTLRYLRDVYKVEPDTAKLSFCLDNTTGLPLKTAAETTYDITKGTTTTFTATEVVLKVDPKEYTLPNTQNQLSPLESIEEAVFESTYNDSN